MNLQKQTKKTYFYPFKLTKMIHYIFPQHFRIMGKENDKVVNLLRIAKIIYYIFPHQFRIMDIENNKVVPPILTWMVS